MHMNTEILRFMRHRQTIAALSVAALIPLLYGALYLWAFWDPTGNLDKLPVAVVNLDEGTTTDDGESLAAGDDLTEELLSDTNLGWETVGQDAAVNGLDDGTYYATLTIPQDFSENLTTVGTPQAATSSLEVHYDDSHGYTARTIVSSVLNKVETAASNTLAEKLADNIFVGVSDAREGIGEAADGATELSDGADDAARGADDLQAGAERLADGSATLSGKLGEAADGANTIAGGAQVLRDGAITAAEAATELSNGAQEVAAGTKALREQFPEAANATAQLHDGAATVHEGTQKLSGALQKASASATTLSDGAATVSSKTAELHTATEQLAAALSAGALDAPQPEPAPHDGDQDADAATMPVDDTAPHAATNAAAGELVAKVQQLNKAAAALDTATTDLAAGAQASEDGLGQLAIASSELTDGTDALQSGLGELNTSLQATTPKIEQLASGSQRLADGTQTLASKLPGLSDGASSLQGGVRDLATGLGTAKDAAGSLSDGAGELRNGTVKLGDGVDKLADGSTTLANSLRDGQEELPELSGSELDRNAEVLADPVELDTVNNHQAHSVGEGLAPYFIGLALFVGTMIMFMLLRPVNPRLLSSTASGLRITLRSHSPAMVLGVAQSVMLYTVLRLGVGLEPEHPVPTIALMLLISAAFVAFQQAIYVWLGAAVGRFVILVLLMLQLTSAGGTYPFETSPALFQALHEVLPLTRVVDGLRASLTGDLDAAYTSSVMYLVVLAILGFAVATLGMTQRRLWNMRRLRPAVSV